MEKTLVIRRFRNEDTAAVVSLWERCGLIHAANNPLKDIARKVRLQDGLFLVGEIDQKIIATVMAGYEGHRGWINYLAVSPEEQKRGHGRKMMEEAERLLRQRGCPKINLQVRRSNPEVRAFYSVLGFTEDDVVSFGKRLEYDVDPGAAEPRQGVT